jgi:hypothetical protein
MESKRRNHISLSLLVLVIAGVIAESCDTANNLEPVYEDYFVRLYGDEGSQEGVDLVVNEIDQTVVLLGTTTEPTGNRRLFLVKADWAGNLIWKKKLGGTNDVAKDIELSNDGGYIILAESQNDLATDATENVKLIRATPEGDKVDSVLFGSVIDGNYGGDRPHSITPMGDSYIVTGSLEYPLIQADQGLQKIAYLKLKFSSDLILDDNFNQEFSQAEFANGIKTFRTSDSRIYTLGSDNKDENGNGPNYNFWFHGFDYLGGESSGGNETSGGNYWIGVDQPGHDEILSAVCPAFGAGFFLVGVHIESTGRRDMYTAQVAIDQGELIRNDSLGKIVVIPVNENRRILPVSVCRALTGRQGYLILGTEGEAGARNIWLSKVNITGESVYWSSLFGAGDLNDDRAGAVAELPDGHILVVGTVNVGVSNLKMGFFKLNAAGRFAE